MEIELIRNSDKHNVIVKYAYYASKRRYSRLCHPPLLQFPSPGLGRMLATIVLLVLLFVSREFCVAIAS